MAEKRREMTKKEDHIALFIDCDNISHRAIEGIINELSKYGVVNIRQAYGNWTKENLKNWEEKLLEFAIKPIQQFDYSKNKNATDILMTIDAIDLLHTKDIDAFAFATSDSDFTPVVMRVQAEGIKVFGFGEKKTPKPFMAACSQFICSVKTAKNCVRTAGWSICFVQQQSRLPMTTAGRISLMWDSISATNRHFLL